jgi:hypothetical protein
MIARSDFPPFAAAVPRPAQGMAAAPRCTTRATPPPEKPAEERPLPGDAASVRPTAANVARELVLVEHAPDRREKSRQFASERSIVSRGVGKHAQLLADEIVERVFRAESAFDRPCGAALLDPDLLEPHDEAASTARRRAASTHKTVFDDAARDPACHAPTAAT